MRLGFLSCGISKVEFLEEEAPRLEKWLNENRNGKMQYMENHFDKRLNPALLVEGAKSVISLLLNYYPNQAQNQGTFKISKYAYGQDYHFIIKEGNYYDTGERHKQTDSQRFIWFFRRIFDWSSLRGKLRRPDPGPRSNLDFTGTVHQGLL